MKKPLCKVAFIGAGYMTIEHVKAFKDIPEVKLVGIHSRTRSKAQLIASEYGIENVYNTINDLYYETKADLVVISVPELSTKDVVLEAFKYPWKCLIEKPVGYNIDEAQYISEYALKNKIEAYVGFNRRHYSSLRFLSEELNKIESKRIIFIQDQEDQNEASRNGQPDLVIDNWMYANSIHLIDLFTVFGRGKIINIENIIKWDPHNPNFVMSKIDFESGDIGIYHAIWNAPSPWSVSISTSTKKFELKPIEYCNILNYGSRTTQQIKIDEIDTKYKAGLRFQAELFVKSLTEKISLPTLNDALISMDLVNRIYRK